MRFKFPKAPQTDKKAPAQAPAQPANNRGMVQNAPPADQSVVVRNLPLQLALNSAPKAFWWGQGSHSGIIPASLFEDVFFRDYPSDFSLLEKILTHSNTAIRAVLKLDVQSWQIAALTGNKLGLEKAYGGKIDSLQDVFGNGVVHYYILGGHLASVEAWLDEHKTILKAGDLTVLAMAELASGAGHPEILALLKRKGLLDLTCYDAESGRTLLHRAVECGQSKTVQWLIKQGVKPELGRCLSLVAAEHDHWKLYSFFVDKKVLPTTPEQVHELMISCARGGKKATIAQLAPSCGVPIEEVKSGGLDLVSAATFGGQLETIEFCWEQGCGNVDQRWDGNTTVLHLAARKGRVKLIWDLLQKYPEQLWCDTLDDSGRSILFYAARHGDWSAFYSLLRSYFTASDLFKPDNRGETIVHVAAGHGHLFFLQELVLNTDKACLQLRDNLNRTPLHHACTSGNLALQRWLVIEHHFSLTDYDKNKQTPLHLLAQEAEQDAYLWKDLVKLAKEFGIECITQYPDAKGKTPMDYLKESHQVELVHDLNEFFQLPVLK